MIADSATRRSQLLALVLLVGLVATSCGWKESRDADDERRRSDTFCVMNPKRDFAELFALVDASGANNEAATGVVEFGARAFDDPPSAIKADVGVVLTQLRSTNGASDGATEPTTKAAIERINTWMRDHCPPTPLTQPTTPTPPTTR